MDSIEHKPAVADASLVEDGGADVEAVIAAFGSVTALARALGHRNVTTVHGWRRSGRIPPWRRHEIAAAARLGGVALPDSFVAGPGVAGTGVAGTGVAGTGVAGGEPPELAGEQAGAGAEGPINHASRVVAGDAAANGNGAAGLPAKRAGKGAGS